MSADDDTLARLADEAAIRTLTAQFADRAMRRDVPGFEALWTEDGVWSIGQPLPGRAEGRVAIGAMLKGLTDRLSFFVQMVHSGVVHLDGDAASARWVVQEVGRLTDGTPYNNYAFYEDVLVRTEGGWRFRSRTYDYLWLDQDSPIRDGLPLPSGLPDL